MGILFSSLLTKRIIFAVTKAPVFVTNVCGFPNPFISSLTIFLPGTTANTRLQTLRADRHASAIVHWRQYVKALYRSKLSVFMFLPDDSKHPQYQLKLYSVHSLADGVRIFLTVTFPFVKSFKFDIVYDCNLGCLRYVGFRRQVTVLVRFGLPPHSSA